MNATFEIPPCPETGRHQWLLAAANYCRNRGIPHDRAASLLAERINRAPGPREIERAVEKSYAQSCSCGTAPVFVPKRRALLSVEPDTDLAQRIAARITPPANWRHWLWERSPKIPEYVTPSSFITHLYRPGERVCVFVDDKAKAPALFADPLVDNPIPTTGPNGVFFLCNPVDANWHPTGELRPDGSAVLSCRNWKATTDWRYFVLESDALPGDIWLAIVAQIPLRIAAIYTSGGKSTHVLCRIDAKSKADWDGAADRLKRPLRKIGGDAGVLSAVRLTRLPGCFRESKHGFQKLLYLNPAPSPEPVCLLDLPRLNDRGSVLNRWCTMSPRWTDARRRAIR